MIAGDTDLATFAKAISKLCGWLYFFAWSASFYPQPLKNFRRRSTTGAHIDYPFINTLGFSSYTISCAAFLYSPTIRRQYAYRHPYSPEPTVRLNDLVFAVHGLLSCIVTYSMYFTAIWGFEVGRNQKASKVILGVFWGSILAVVTTVLIVRTQGSDNGETPSGWAWIDAIYAIGYVKIAVTLVKYAPQVILNYQRKATTGFSIWQIQLDFIGGILSLIQLVIDSALQADWSGLTGNPVKLGLSSISLVFDIMFIIQHHILYRHSDRKAVDGDSEGADERSSLINSSNGTATRGYSG